MDKCMLGMGDVFSNDATVAVASRRAAHDKLVGSMRLRAVGPGNNNRRLICCLCSVASGTNSPCTITDEAMDRPTALSFMSDNKILTIILPRDSRPDRKSYPRVFANPETPLIEFFIDDSPEHLKPPIAQWQLASFLVHGSLFLVDKVVEIRLEGGIREERLCTASGPSTRRFATELPNASSISIPPLYLLRACSLRGR